LRRKLDSPGGPSHIETLRGRGYVFHLGMIKVEIIFVAAGADDLGRAFRPRWC